MLEVGSGEKLQPALDWKVLPQCLHLPLIWRRAAQWCSTPAVYTIHISRPDMLAMFDNGQNGEYNSVVIIIEMLGVWFLDKLEVKTTCSNKDP